MEFASVESGWSDPSFILCFMNCQEAVNQRVLGIGESMSITVQANRLGAEPKLHHPDGRSAFPCDGKWRETRSTELILSQAELPGFHEAVTV